MKGARASVSALFYSAHAALDLLTSMRQTVAALTLGQQLGIYVWAAGRLFVGGHKVPGSAEECRLHALASSFRSLKQSSQVLVP